MDSKKKNQKRKAHKCEDVHSTSNHDSMFNDPVTTVLYIQRNVFFISLVLVLF